MDAATETRVQNLLSIAARARRIVSGAFMAEEMLRKKRGAYLLLATDASEETKDKFTQGVPAKQSRIEICGTEDDCAQEAC